MDASRVQIGLLEGKSNWSTWKYKLCILLRGIPGAIDVIEGRLTQPSFLSTDALEEEKLKYENDLVFFTKADSNALLVLTINMTQETLQKVMRFSTAREVWLELHRLYDGNVDDKTYDLCMQFFSYKRQAGDDIATHTSKLKNLWNELQVEISKDKVAIGNDCKCDLPELLLICRVLGTLPEEYFSFKSSWMLMSKSDRTIDNLTNQLCTYEKALSSKSESNQEILAAERNRFNLKDRGKLRKDVPNRYEDKAKFKKPIFCYYCKEAGHKVKQCAKWKADGRPPKAENERTNKSDNSVNITLMAVTSSVLVAECDRDSWFVDNGATNHITNRNDLFETYESFRESHTVTTASGDLIGALGKGTIVVETDVKERQEKLTLTDVWYVPDIKKNLFSVLSAQDKNPKSQFISSAEVCSFQVNGESILRGTRSRYGGLFKLMLRNVRPETSIQVNAISKNENLLQLYHERFGHQNKRHVRSVISLELNINVNLDSEL